MASTQAARTVIGIIGNFISFLLFLSPMPTFIHICKKKSVEQYSMVPYLATVFNCGLWLLYALPMVHPHSTLLATVNGSGFVIEIVYLLLFFLYSGGEKRMKVVLIMLAEFLFMAVLALLVLTLAHSTKMRSTIVGSICMVANIMMYASPLAVMKLVITTKSVEYMPFFVSLASFASSVIWTAYACLPFDPFIVVPNGVGSVFGLAQLLLYAWFYNLIKKKLEQEEEDKSHKTEVSMAEKPMSIPEIV